MKALFIATFVSAVSLMTATGGFAQDVPGDYQQVRSTLGKQGDYKAHTGGMDASNSSQCATHASSPRRAAARCTRTGVRW